MCNCAEGSQLLQLAVARDLVTVTTVKGQSYGANALTVSLKSRCPLPLRIEIARGTVFQHVGWVHKQNLMVSATVAIEIFPGKSATRKIDAYCMNSTCACSAGETMELTEFILDPALQGRVLATQGETWRHLEEV